MLLFNCCWWQVCLIKLGWRQVQNKDIGITTVLVIETPHRTGFWFRSEHISGAEWRITTSNLCPFTPADILVRQNINNIHQLHHHKLCSMPTCSSSPNKVEGLTPPHSPLDSMLMSSHTQTDALHKFGHCSWEEILQEQSTPLPI